MKIDKIELNNYRGFRKQKEISFKDRLNIFVGVNGAGKSSLLDLIASFLNNFTVKFSGDSYHSIEQNITILDIHIDEEETNNKIHVTSNLINNKSISWELKRDFKRGKNNFDILNSFIRNYQGLFKNNPNQSIPIFKYFQSQRNSTEKRRNYPSKKRYLAEQFKVYDDAFDKTLEFDKFISWFIEEENVENREKVSLFGGPAYTNPYLEAVRKALNLFLKEIPHINYANLRVESRKFNLKTNEKSSLVIDKNDKTYNLKQLSDGERMLILMVFDIAHRLSIANPNTEDCLTGNGVVLIDEIDLHLHPMWQRAVIPALLQTFPKIQFFITTHSPQVLSNVKSENIFIIEDFNIVKLTPNTYGKDSNSILWDIFGVDERPKHSKKKLERLYDLLDDESKQEEAKDFLEGLSKQLGEDDPEILNAKLHFAFQTNID